MLLVPAAQANIVLNGGFDLDTPSTGVAPLDWTLTPAAVRSEFIVGNDMVWGVLSPPNSANFAASGPPGPGNDDVLSQVLATIPGQTYTLDYFLANDDGMTMTEDNDFSVSWGGVTIPGSVLTNATAFNYREFTFTEVATSTTTTLAFAGREVPGFYNLDNVSVNPSTLPVPEPGYLAVLPAALGVLLFARRRRQTQA
ncbi:MAG TPA: PEP-CTERM sorting domain-containing protein [Bryobacteraceae bacterium]|nr:PEP-CTERM sorting domain-containing protein [Bryobacteraceae bacterium]